MDTGGEAVDGLVAQLEQTKRLQKFGMRLTRRLQALEQGMVARGVVGDRHRRNAGARRAIPNVAARILRVLGVRTCGEYKT